MQPTIVRVRLTISGPDADHIEERGFMRIAILSDIHANLLFAEAAVRRARHFGCDRIIHLGDAVDLGPWPSETLDFMISNGIEMLRGNHDEYPVMGLTPKMERELAPEVKQQIKWTASQLRGDQHAYLAALPTTLVSHVDEWKVRFQHFLLDDGRVSEKMIHKDADSLFQEFKVESGEIVCFGHIHTRIWHFAGNRGILNPGATGFTDGNGAWFAVLVIRDSSAWLEWHPVEASSDLVAAELEERAVPGWESSISYMFVPADRVSA